MPISVNLYANPGVAPIDVMIVDTKTGHGETFQLPSAGASTLILPFTIVEISRLIFAVRFQLKYIINLAADVGNLNQMQITQRSNYSVEMNLQHEAFGDPCTVTCLASGESRTGVNPCIECSVGERVVRLCC